MTGSPTTLGVVQARMSSHRLPGKVLRRMAGRTVLERVAVAADASGAVDEFVIATSTAVEDDPIAVEADRLGLPCHRGELDDVLSRFLGAVDAHPHDAVMRFTADCPLLDPDLIALTGRVFRAANVDYVSTGLARTLPRGLDVEIARTDALRAAAEKATGHHRSHVTSYIYSHPEVFSVLGLHLPPDRSGYRLTLDTEEDWRLMTHVADRFGDRITSLDELTGWLDHNPDVAAINAAVPQKPLEEG